MTLQLPTSVFSTITTELQWVFQPDGVFIYILKFEALCVLIYSIIMIFLLRLLACAQRWINSFFQWSLCLILSFKFWKRSPFIHDIFHPIPYPWTYTIFRSYERDFATNQLKVPLQGPILCKTFFRLFH